VELRCGRCKKPIIVLFEDEKDRKVLRSAPAVRRA
jgi:hypothetical protein